MTAMHPLIVIEGNPGTGKSTAASVLADRLSAALFHFPPEFVEFRKRVDIDVRVRPLANLLYHLGASVHLSDLVKEALEKGPVICDRWVASPLALLVARGAFEEEHLFALVRPFVGELAVPRATIVLEASDDRVKARIEARAAARGESTLRAGERWSIEVPGLAVRRAAALESLTRRIHPGRPIAHIDTTNLDVDATCGTVEALARRALDEVS